MRITTTRLAGWVTVAISIMTFSRVAVLFLESLSVVREERLEDVALLELCADARAKGSPKLRAACLQAQAERASPIVLKAIVKAVQTTWNEFTESISSPFGMATCVLFVLSSLVLPIVPMLKAVAFASSSRRAAIKAHGSDDEDSDAENPHIIVLNHGGGSGISRRKMLKHEMA